MFGAAVAGAGHPPKRSPFATHASRALRCRSHNARLQPTPRSATMTYAQGRTYYDADSHIMELPGFLTDHADPDIREQLPPIKVPRVGKLANLVAEAEHARAHPPAHVAELVALGD